MIQCTLKREITMTKYNSCRICGLDAEVGYVNPITGLCNVCTGDEEYNEHERRVSGC